MGDLLHLDPLPGLLPDEGNRLPGEGPGHIGHVQKELVHAHPARHRAGPSVHQRPPAQPAQRPGQTVPIADGDYRQPGLPNRLKIQAVARPLPGGQRPDTGNPGPQGENGPQVRASARPIESDARPGIAAGLRRQVQNASAGPDVYFPRIMPAASQPVHRPVEPLQLPLGVVPVGRVGAVGYAQMGEHPGNIQVLHPIKPVQRAEILCRDAQAAHPGIQSQMDGEPPACGVQGPAMGLVRHRLGQSPANQQWDRLRRRVSQNQDHPLHPRPAERDSLVQAGHGESGHPLPRQPPGSGDGPVAVGIRLHHRHQPAPGVQQVLKDPGVVGQGVQVDFLPGPGSRVSHSAPPSKSHGAAGPRQCSRRVRQRRPPPLLLFLLVSRF